MTEERWTSFGKTSKAALLTRLGADLHRTDLLCVQPSYFICHFAIPEIPKSKRAIKVPGADHMLVSGASHRVAAAVADDGARAEALVQIPHLDAAICAAADCPRGCAAAAVDTAHLQHHKK